MNAGIIPFPLSNEGGGRRHCKAETAREFPVPAHVVCCGRAKQDYVLNQVEKNGRTVNVPEKVGLKAITREGFDYEMTVSFDLLITHFAATSKDRTREFITRAEHAAMVRQRAGGADDFILRGDLRSYAMVAKTMAIGEFYESVRRH